MNNINFNQTGGFPLSTNILDALQTAYTVFNSLGNLAGNLAIISGCDVTGSTVSDGFVFINGELFDFKGGTIGDNVIIMQDIENRSFEDGSSKPVLYKRYATFGTALENYPWEGFKRIFPTTLIKEFKDDHEDRLQKLEKSVPIGLVAIWGQALPLPPGWVPYTFLNGKTPVGRKAGDPNFSVLGSTVGSAEVTLDITQIPPHSHGFNAYKGVENKVPNTGNGQNGGNQNLTTDSVGGGKPHSNIQPSGIVEFMIFVGFQNKK